VGPNSETLEKGTATVKFEYAKIPTVELLIVENRGGVQKKGWGGV